MTRKLARLVRIRSRQQALAVAHHAAAQQRLGALEAERTAIEGEYAAASETLVRPTHFQELDERLQGNAAMQMQARLEIHRRIAVVQATSVAKTRAEILADRAKAALRQARDQAEQHHQDDLAGRRRS